LTHQASLHDSYALCRTIAKREAKNFYYAFLALPAPRRNAICAVYAFMRQADDLADDESLSRVELVASVVGLVCIRIFGYSDPRAEKFAEETGIAFQLTNILRDVAEDADRNRVYLPKEDLAAYGVSLDALLNRPAATPPAINERALLAVYAARAEKYYRSADALLPLIDKESRPALWVLVTIYHALLKRIKRAGYDVFTRRASVPTPQKLAILAVGLARTAVARLYRH